MKTDSCIVGKKNIEDIKDIKKQQDRLFHTCADLSRNLYETQNGIREVGRVNYQTNQNVEEIKELLLGSVEKKGALHEITDTQKEMKETQKSFQNHLEESDKYRPMIEESYKITNKIKKRSDNIVDTIIHRITNKAVDIVFLIIAVIVAAIWLRN